MAKVLTENEIGQEVEPNKVYLWRLQWLRSSGFSKRNAELLASSSVELHFACRAIQNAKKKGVDEDEIMRLVL
jgi:hypothetical protein